MNFRKWIILLTFLSILVGCGAEATPTPAVTEPSAAATEAPRPEMMAITLPMGYIADPQFAPLYVAIEKGYFAEEGFEITFDYSFETDGVALVGAGQQPFALVSGDVVLSARAEGVPIVYVMEWYQKYPIAIVSKKSANIATPADLTGRKVGLPGFFGASYVGYSGLLNAAGLKPEDVLAEEVGFNQVEVLVTDQVEAVVGYINNEPVQLQKLGEEIQIIPVSDYADMVATGFVTNETFAAENPGRVAGFIRAFTRGLQDTLANPDEAYEISKKYVEGLDDERKPVLQASLPLWQASQLGYSDPAAWEKTQEVLLGMGFLSAPLADLSSAYSNEFLVQP